MPIAPISSSAAMDSPDALLCWTSTPEPVEGAAGVNAEAPGVFSPATCSRGVGVGVGGRGEGVGVAVGAGYDGPEGLYEGPLGGLLGGL